MAQSMTFQHSMTPMNRFHSIQIGSVLLAALGILQLPLHAKEGYPPFSWDKVPLYAHFGISTGVKPEDYDFLAKHYDFIAITAGRKVGDDYTSAELYTAEAAREIKKRNPDATVLFYWATDKPKHQSKISNDRYPGDYYDATEKRGGQERKHQLFDLRRQEVLDWWSDAAGAAIHKYGCDGIYVDGATSGTENDKYQRLLDKESADAMHQGTISMLRDAKKKMGGDKLIIFNPLHPDSGKVEMLKYSDGAMIDDFDRVSTRPQSKEYMLSSIKLLRDTSRSGKIVVFKTWPRFSMLLRRDPKMLNEQEKVEQARKDITFALACFLLGAEVNSYFCYSWGWNAPEGTFVAYPEYDKPLGPPKGDFVQDDWTFTREFAHASVFVDLEKRTGRIDWK